MITDEHMNAVLDNFQMRGSTWLLWKAHKKWRISVALGWIGDYYNSLVVLWVQYRGDANASNPVDETAPENHS